MSSMTNLKALTSRLSCFSPSAEWPPLIRPAATPATTPAAVDTTARQRLSVAPLCSRDQSEGHGLQLVQRRRERSTIWMTSFGAADSLGFSHLQSMSKDYWQEVLLGRHDHRSQRLHAPQTPMFGRSNMYGPGLYLAVDPVATAGYGGGAELESDADPACPRASEFSMLEWAAASCFRRRT